jgi:hypothetical protein
MSAKRIFTMRIDTRDVASTAEEVQRLRGGLADRRQLHARIAVQGAEFTRDYLRGLGRHKTATALGARPTQHHARAARGIEADSNAETAVLRIPRSSGLSRAFQDFVIRPGSGKKLLTIPADKRTYGKRAGEFAPGVLVFAFSVEKRTPLLIFADGSGVAYFLVPVVRQKQDRTLLPSDKAYRTLARGVTSLYIDELLGAKGGPA